MADYFSPVLGSSMNPLKYIVTILIDMNTCQKHNENDYLGYWFVQFYHIKLRVKT